MYHLTSFLLSLLLLTSAHANQIRFFRQHRACNASEPFFGCDNIGPNICCSPPNNTIPVAVSVSKSSNNVALTFRGSVNNCRDQLCSPTGGQGSFCCIATSGVRVSGASFYNSKRRSAAQTQCTTSMLTNIIGYSNGTHGQWKLEQEQVRDQFEELSAEFDLVPNNAKIDWLQRRGAVYERLPEFLETRVAEPSW